MDFGLPETRNEGSLFSILDFIDRNKPKLANEQRKGMDYVSFSDPRAG